MLYTLALIPVAGILLFIYFNDKKEKEPFGFLIGLFFLGMATVVSAFLAEMIGIFIMNAIVPDNAALNQILLAILIVAPAEELGKFAVLRIRTWKSRHFNYSFDAIVYAVFVSLGFAALENVGYVNSGGVGAAVIRMLTAVPGHACFGVFMGFFYGKAKHAQLTDKKGKCALHILLSILVPVILHGIYDAILFGSGTSDEVLVVGASMIAWIMYVIAMFVASIIVIIISSKRDFCIVTIPESTVQTIYRPAVAGTWVCSCGLTNYFSYCSRCGQQRPVVTSWYCARCGALSAYNFCGNCGCPKPQDPLQTPGVYNGLN